MSFMGKFLIGSIVILSSSCVLSNTKTLSDIEKQIVLSVESSFNSQVDFLEKVVNINSGTRNKVGVKAVGEVFIQAFNKLGFKSSWIDMPAKMDRAGHMLGERSFGAGGKKILLMGHLDTVFPINSPFQKFERTTVLNGSKVKGPGVTDMKDGNTIILFALKSLIEGGFIKKGQVSVFFTGDEESSGKPISTSELAKHAGTQFQDVYERYMPIKNK